MPFNVIPDCIVTDAAEEVPLNKKKMHLPRKPSFRILHRKVNARQMLQEWKPV